jgi:hypothetical protein
MSATAGVPASITASRTVQSGLEALAIHTVGATTIRSVPGDDPTAKALGT